jgi:hypothetical protein
MSHAEREPDQSSPGAAEVIRKALEQFAAMTGKQPEGVTGVRATDDGGWSVLVDMLELERVPSSTSVLATYRVELDGQAQLRSYERVRRYRRSATD